MSALSTHHKRNKRSETKEEQRSTKEKNSKIDPLRQGQWLDAIDQKRKHDSSKTEVMLDAVMQEAERKLGAKTKAETPQAKFFPLTSATLPK